MSTLSSPQPVSMNDLPLDELLEKDVTTMSPEELTAYVQRCALLRSSAQSRKAALVKEGVEKQGAKPKTKKKDSVAMALAYLTQIKK
jgi:hypothetical protein